MWCLTTSLALVFACLLTKIGQGQILSDSELASSIERKCSIPECPNIKPRPVCGSDGNTYFSKCELQRQVQCDGKTIQVKHKGKCAEESRCRAERVRAQKSKRPLPAAFVPECREDGSYAEIQCHTPTRYCWCVTETGMPIPGSSVTNKRPVCNHNNVKPNNAKRRSSRGKKERKGCSQADRSTFNANLVKIFVSEYNRLPSTSATTTKSTSVMDTEEKRAVEWKFSELNRNGDYDLDKKELQALRRMLKKIVRPRPCARAFTRTCDQNQDKRINKAEWTLCLGVDMNISFRLFLFLNSDEQTDHMDRDDSSSMEHEAPSLWNRQITTLSAHVRPTDTNIRVTDDDLADCSSHRQAAQDDQRNNEGNVFVPECSADGKYNKMQCYKPTGYCWCVDPDSGKTVAGTTLHNAQPDCEKTFRFHKPIKGCTPERKKQQFLRELVDSFVKELVLSNQSGSGVVQQNTDIANKPNIREIEAALRKLRSLDTNNNQVIDKKEWKDFKNEIKRKKVMRKCGRNFLKYCDDDNNRKVTEDEWISCLGLREAKVQNTSRRPGKNPLEIYLN